MRKFEAADAYTSNTIRSRDNVRRLRAACTVIKVDCCADTDAAELEEGEDTIARSSCLRIIRCFTSLIVERTVPGTLAAKAPALHADVLIIMIDRIYFEHRARLTLGNMVPKVAEGYAATDPFITFPRLRAGRFVALLIALEFKHSIIRIVAQRHSIIQVKTVLLIALLAVSPKFIILDAEMSPAHIVALASVVVALRCGVLADTRPRSTAGRCVGKCFSVIFQGV
jgi:hypothetical protein